MTHNNTFADSLVSIPKNIGSMLTGLPLGYFNEPQGISFNSAQVQTMITEYLAIKGIKVEANGFYEMSADEYILTVK